MKPTLFIGSSAESVSIAYGAQQNLQRIAEVTVWDQGVFRLSQTNLESLLATLDRSDFGLFVFSPDDLLIIRGEENAAVRDNVLFELGLFVGRLNRERCFIVTPTNTTDLRFPTDLLGISPGTYEPNRSDGNFQAAIGPACYQIRQAIEKIGKRTDRQQVGDAATESRQEVKEERTTAEETGIPAQRTNQEDRDKYKWFRAYMEKDYSLALELLRDRISNLGDDAERPDLESWAGRTQYRLNAEIGTKVLENLISQYPKDFNPYIHLAFAHVSRELFEEALAVFDCGIAAAAEKQLLLTGKARVLKDIGREDDAIVLLEDSIRNQPFHPSYFLQLAQLFRSLKKNDEARKVFELGITKAPNDKELLSAYAELLNEGSDAKLALLPYTRLVDLDPKNPTYLTLRANVYILLDLNDAAMAGYKTASELAEHKQGWILGNIGNLYKNRGLFTDAIDYFKKAIEIDPDSDYAHERLATALKQREEEKNRLQTVVTEAYKALVMQRMSPDTTASVK